MDERLKSLLLRLAHDQRPCRKCGDPGCELSILITYNFGDKTTLGKEQLAHAKRAMELLLKP